MPMRNIFLALGLALFASTALAAPPTQQNYNLVNLSWGYEASLFGGVGGAAPFQLDANGNLLVNVAAGGGTGGSGGAVTAIDGAFVNLGTLGDAPYTGTGNASITAILKGIYTNQPILAAGLEPVVQTSPKYALVSNSVVGSAITSSLGGSYLETATATNFNGGSVTITSTYNGTTSTQTLSANLAPVCINVGAGTGLSAAVTGSPTGLYVTFAGIGPAPCSSASAQAPPVVASTTQGAASVTTSSTQIIAASSGTRGRIDLANTAAAGSGNNAWCSTGGNTAVVGQGIEVFAGGTAEELYPNIRPQAVNCIMATGTASIGWEAYQ